VRWRVLRLLPQIPWISALHELIHDVIGDRVSLLLVKLSDRRTE
jgi:hypothetical protein